MGSITSTDYCLLPTNNPGQGHGQGHGQGRLLVLDAMTNGHILAGYWLLGYFQLKKTGQGQGHGQGRLLALDAMTNNHILTVYFQLNEACPPHCLLPTGHCLLGPAR